MNTHATSERQWTETSLAALQKERGFRLRGLEVTRLDTFIDAAFAFVLTLLVISFDELPSSNEEMVLALKRVPAFAASFATLMMFWLQHRLWSRRYGLENTRTVTLSLALIFVVLVYVYPLRTLFEGMFYSLSDGYFPAFFRISTEADLRTMFVTYSVGFLVMAILVCLLHQAALHDKDALGLNSTERQITKANVLGWLIAACFGLASILLALFVPFNWVTSAGYIYFVLFPVARLSGYLDRRKRQLE